MSNNILALIPARGGSKGIPHKNIIDLAGKPMIAYSIEAAVNCPLISRTIVSTDDPEIASAAKAYGAEVPFMRPADASSDSAPAIDVILHALDWLKQNENYTPEILVYLQPTSPLRKNEHLTEALTAFINNQSADSLVSVIKPPHNVHPQKIMKLRDNFLVPYLEDQGLTKLDRHGLPEFFARNGPAILAGRIKIFTENKALYGSNIMPYIMSAADSIDIDYPEDLELAEFYLERRKKNG